MSSVHPSLKLCCIFMGIVLSLVAFLWNLLILYVLSQTNPHDSDLVLARYLDIFLGVVGFTSALAFTYGSCVERKLWLGIWILGSFIVVISYWIRYVWLRYGTDPGPESMDQYKSCLIILSLVHGACTIPVVIYFKQLEPTRSMFDHVCIHWQPWTSFWIECSSRDLSEKPKSTSSQTVTRSSSRFRTPRQESGRCKFQITLKLKNSS